MCVVCVGEREKESERERERVEVKLSGAMLDVCTR